MPQYLDHITLGQLVETFSILGMGSALLHKITPIIENHQRNVRWLETLWEEYNQRNGGGWRIAPGAPSERLHSYQTPQKGIHP